MSGIFNAKYDDYLGKVTEYDEQVDSENIDINDEQDLDQFVSQHEAGINQRFLDGDYSYTNEGKSRCIEDYVRRNKIRISLAEGFTIDDIIEEIDWSESEGDIEVAVDSIEELIESMQSFISDYRNNDAYMPNLVAVIGDWMKELDDIYQQIL